MPTGDDLEVKVSRQVEAAVREADLVLLVVDAAVGMTDDDEAIAAWLRRDEHAVIVVANKADNDRREDERWEFLALGLGEPYPISALHGRRAGDLLDEVVDRLPAPARRAGRRGRRGRRCRDAVDARRVAPAARGHRRPAERRQEHAVQPAGRSRPLRRPRPRRDDPRRHRHTRRDRGRTDRLRRHGRDAAAVADRRLGRVLLAGAGAAGDRRRRHRACS